MNASRAGNLKRSPACQAGLYRLSSKKKARSSAPFRSMPSLIASLRSDQNMSRASTALAKLALYHIPLNLTNPERSEK